MGKDEKTLILEMVAKGQVTPEEGVDLLRAIKAPGPIVRMGYLKAPSDETPARKRLKAEIPKMEGESAPKPKGEIKDGAGVLGQVGVSIGRALSQRFAGSFLGGPKFEFVEEVKGDLSETGELRINLRTSNGAVSVESWDRPNYLLTVTKGVRAENRSEAEEILKDCFDFKQEGLFIDAHTANGSVLGLPRLSVAFSLKIPSSRRASLSLNSANGRINTHGVTGSFCEANTADGRIQMSRCTFEEAKLRTVNGRVRYEGAAEGLDISTDNGRIEAELRDAGDWRFNSRTGRIQVDVHKEKDAAYELDLFSNVGRVVVEGLGDVQVISDETRSATKGRYHARSRGFEKAEKKGLIKAATSLGRIQVLF